MRVKRSSQYKSLALRLRQARREAGLTQREAAELLSTTQSRLSKIEAGRLRLDLVQLKKFAGIYKKDITFFLEPPVVPFNRPGEPQGYLMFVQKGGGGRREPSDFPKTTQDDVIWETDRNGKITYISPAVKKHLGYEVAELLGKNANELFPPEIAPLAKKFLRRAARSPQAFYVSRKLMVTKNGKTAAFESSAVPFFDENFRLRGYRGVDKPADKAALSRGETPDAGVNCAALVELSPDGMAIIQDWKIAYANPAFRKMTGCSAKEAAGRDALDFIPADRRDFAAKRYAARLSGQNVAQTYDTALQTKNGGRIEIQLSMIPIRHKNRLAHLAVLRDITQRKREIDKLWREAENAAHASGVKNQYLANLSHEIRTPVNAIKGFCELLAATPLTEVQRDYLNMVSESSDVLLLIIGDILDISKIEAGKIELEEIDFNLRELAKNAVKMTVPALSGKPVRIEINYPESVSDWFLGDPTRVRQILVNLLSNAAKFTQEGTITLDVEMKSGFVTVTVKDTGIGIPAEKQKNLFDIFTQVSLATTREYGGTGLGLAIVKMLAEKMEGGVALKSEEGKGSAFTVRLRLRPGKPLPAAEPALALRENAQVYFAGAKVLVAEDNPVNLKLLSILLKKLGCEVDSCVNGKQAVEKASAKSYHLVIMDMIMPEMNGMDAARALRKLGSKTPIIALTAAAMKEDRDSAFSAGINDYITKPINSADLEEKLKKYLTGYN